MEEQMMLARMSPLLAVAALFFVVAPSLPAQPGPPSSGTGPRYDKTTETKVDGTVKEVVHTEGGPRRGQKGLHLVLQAGDGTMTVHLGPADWIESKKFTFAAGDVISVVGSRVEIEAKPVVIAREVSKGEAKLQLRDANGKPLWAGGPR
jgi:DNA/RNA endonuclease YhcR with UshA esterase domain